MYTSQANALNNVFYDWLSNFNNKLIQQNRRILLLLDNFSGNFTNSVFSQIELLFLPPKTTAKLQPLDAGILSCFKQHYRKLLSARSVANIENYSSVDQFIKGLSLAECLKSVSNAWENVSSETVVNCWKHCGYEAWDFVYSPNKIYCHARDGAFYFNKITKGLLYL